MSKTTSYRYRPFLVAWKLVLIVNNRGVKRNVVGKKCITSRPYAVARVSGDASELLSLGLYQNAL